MHVSVSQADGEALQRVFDTALASLLNIGCGYTSCIVILEGPPEFLKQLQGSLLPTLHNAAASGGLRLHICASISQDRTQVSCSCAMLLYQGH